MQFRIKQFVALACVGACLVGCNTKSTNPKVSVGSPELTDSESVTNTPQKVDPLMLPANVIKDCKEATVLIGNFQGGQLFVTGSGFVVGDGTRIVTNKHVVTGDDDEVDSCKIVFYSGGSTPKLLKVTPQNIRVFASAKRKDEDYFQKDLAVIRIPKKISKPLEIDKDLRLAETEPAWAFGFPSGTKISPDSSDLPSPTVHSLRLERIERQDGEITVVQLGGSPTYGNSGGPVVNTEGKVIGVLEGKIGASSIVFAVPPTSLSKLMNNDSNPGLIAKEWMSPMGEPKPAPRMVAKTSPHLNPRVASLGSSVLSTRLVSSSDLQGLSAFDLTILRNEPFARRGYIFRRAELRQIFGASGWYVPTTSNMAAVQSALSKTEATNVNYVKNYQVAHGLEW